jgi:hypothetical protein
VIGEGRPEEKKVEKDIQKNKNPRIFQLKKTL